MIIDPLALWGIEGISQEDAMRLIEAAPDMLAALKAAVSQSEAAMRAAGQTLRTDDAQAVYDTVQAAIAKAEGRKE